MLEVWGAEPRVALSPGPLTPWQYSAEAGAGFGLAIAARVVRNLGWGFSVAGGKEAVAFRISIPTADLIAAGAG